MSRGLGSLQTYKYLLFEAIIPSAFATPGHNAVLRCQEQTLAMFVTIRFQELPWDSESHGIRCNELAGDGVLATYLTTHSSARSNSDHRVNRTPSSNPFMQTSHQLENIRYASAPSRRSPAND